MSTTDSSPRADFWRRPYTGYREIQRQSPVHYDPDLSAWLVTSYDAVRAALHHPSLSSAWLERRADMTAPDAAAAKFVHSVLSRWFVLTDAPEHAELRGVVGRAFTPRTIAAMKPFIRDRVEYLMSAAAAKGTVVDVISDVAAPLSAAVINRIIGLDPALEASMPKWADVLARYLANISRRDLADQTAAMVSDMEKAIRARLRDRALPEGTVLHDIAQRTDRGTAAVAEAVSTVSLLLYAGFEATSQAVGLVTLALLDHPRLRGEIDPDDDAAVAAAAEELLRFDTPVLQLPRIASADLELDGCQIRSGDLVVVVLGAANHDERHYQDPDVIRLGRDPGGSLVFGHGAHFCIGAALARSEIACYLTYLLRRAPDFVSAGEPRWNRASTVRMLESVPVVLHPGPHHATSRS
ncbi:MAG TPA: cytochrome P450 [Streptosporangiaceae bacterium]|nr:cytochrome P450 [Streptosporangiaceae bacterium]